MTPLSRPSVFCDTALAQRVERAEVGLICALSRAAQRRHDGDGFLTPVAGGIASFAEKESPYNKVAGLGFEGIPSQKVLDSIERAFAHRGSATQVELSQLADPELGAVLTRRGYVLESF